MLAHRLYGFRIAGTLAFANITDAKALCAINGSGMNLSPTSVSAGTYTPPNSPSSPSASLTINGTYTDLLGGTCTVALSFQRSPYPPATMSNTGGGSATLAYTITSSSSGGGNTIFYTGSSASSGNVVLYTFSTVGLLGINRPFTATLTIYPLMLPGTPQAAGSYSDTITASVFDGNSGINVYTRSFTVTGTVAKACLIGNVAHPGADSAVIPVSVAGAVTTAPISKSYANVVCNTPSNIQLTSQNGAVMAGASPPSGFTNLINYSSSATFSGATATLDTSTNPSATGPEAGASVSTTGTTPSGTLSVTITPQANALSLMAGPYADTLTITITPQ